MNVHIISPGQFVQNITIEKPFKLKDGSKRAIIYQKINKTNKCKLLYFKSPKLVLSFSLEKPKWGSLSLSLHPYHSKIKQFVETIKSLEKCIRKKIKTKCSFKSCLDIQSDSMKRIKINLSKQYKIDSIIDDLVIDDLKRDGEIKFVMKAPYIWFRDGVYGIYYSIQRIKYYPPLFTLDIDFWDDDETKTEYSIKDLKNKPKKSNILPPTFQSLQMPPLPTLSIPEPYVSNKKKSISRKSSFIPSVKDLMKIKATLKKVKKHS